MQPLYIDTNIFIYLLEDNRQFSIQTVAILTHFQDSGTPFITSEITITEFLSGFGDGFDELRTLGNLSFLPTNQRIAEQAGKLRHHSKLDIGDALHLATALEYKAQQLFTNDAAFAKVARDHIKVIGL